MSASTFAPRLVDDQVDGQGGGRVVYPPVDPRIEALVTEVIGRVADK